MIKYQTIPVITDEERKIIKSLVDLIEPNRHCWWSISVNKNYYCIPCKETLISEINMKNTTGINIATYFNSHIKKYIKQFVGFL